MTRLSNFREFIGLIETDWTDNDHNFEYLDDRLSALLPDATSEILILQSQGKKTALNRVNDLLKKYENTPNWYPDFLQYGLIKACLTGASVVFLPEIMVGSFFFKSALSALRAKLKGKTKNNIRDEAHLKIVFLLQFKFIIEQDESKQTPTPQETGDKPNIIKSIFKSGEGEQKQVPPPQKIESKPDIPNPEIKPIFKPEEVPKIFDILKSYFSPTHQKQLLRILKSGNDVSQPLIFLDNGNRLADSFKQLVDAGIVTGCEKKEFENWIFRNFKYRNNGIIKSFTLRYLNDIISAKNDLCRNPILNVSRDKATGNVRIMRV